MAKAVLAFSGGLDTTVVVKYLQDEHNLDVVTVTVDVGQGEDYEAIREKSRALGAVSHHTIDARREFVLEYIHPAIMANALYQGKYCLATALARPLIARKVLEVARAEGASALAHGCSGKGNDQVRFDLAFMIRLGSAHTGTHPGQEPRQTRRDQVCRRARRGGGECGQALQYRPEPVGTRH